MEENTLYVYPLTTESRLLTLYLSLLSTDVMILDDEFVTKFGHDVGVVKNREYGKIKVCESSIIEKEMLDKKNFKVYSNECAGFKIMSNSESDLVTCELVESNRANIFQNSQTSIFSVPVIYVVNTFDSAESTEVALKYKAYLEKEGYKVAMITKTKYPVRGCWSYDELANDSNPIINLDKMKVSLRSIDKSYEPDVFIFDIPNGTVELGDVHNSYGYYLKYYSLITPINYLVSIFPLNLINEMSIHNVKKYYQKHYGLHLDNIIVTNEKYDFNEVIENKFPSPLYVSEENIKLNYVKNKSDLTYIWDNQGIKNNVVDFLRKFS